MDFKVRCVVSRTRLFRVGEVYEVRNGTIKAEDGFPFDAWGFDGATFEHLHQWFSENGIEFEEVKEEQTMKFKVGDKVKVISANGGRADYIGRVFTIREINPNGFHHKTHYGVVEPCGYIFYDDELEKYEDQLERIKETFSKFKGVSDMKNLVAVKNVIFNPPATIIHWSDNTKSVVKCQNGEPFDAEKGFVMAYLKKQLGNDNTFNKEITKWVKYEPPVEKVEEKVVHGYRVGDRVVYKGHVGTIIGIGTDDDFLVEFDEAWSDGLHNGNCFNLKAGNRGTSGRCYWCLEGEIEHFVLKKHFKAEEPTHKFKVGDRVVCHGNEYDFNDQFDGLVCTVERINEGATSLKYYVESDKYPCGLNFREEQLELAESKPIKKDRYEPGDKVKIIDHRGEIWNHKGKMDKYIGAVLTVRDTFVLSDKLYIMEECPEWCFDYNDIVGVVEDTAKEEPKSKYYNGKVVCIDNKFEDFIHIDEFTIGKVYPVVEGRVKGDTGWSYSGKAETLRELCVFMGTTFIPLKE